MPACSIIMPSFNAGPTIGKAIDSIRHQTSEDWDLSIQDGASTDNTLEIIQDYSKNDKRINYISEPDNGIYDAMNKGIMKAKGEWLFFLGADDTLFDNTVLHNVFSKIAKKSTNILYGNVEIVGNNAWAKDGDVYDGEFSIKKLVNKNICHQAIFYRADFIKSHIGNFNTAYKLCADWDFNLRCWSKTAFVFYDKIIARFNAGGESTKNNADKNFTNDLVENLLSYFNISVFDPLISNPDFWQYPQVLQLQRQKSYIRYLGKRLMTKATTIFK